VGASIGIICGLPALFVAALVSPAVADLPVEKFCALSTFFVPAPDAWTPADCLSLANALYAEGPRGERGYVLYCKIGAVVIHLTPAFGEDMSHRSWRALSGPQNQWARWYQGWGVSIDQSSKEVTACLQAWQFLP
jgi:hypothetical protein